MKKDVTVTVAATKEICVDVTANVANTMFSYWRETNKASLDLQRVFTLKLAEFGQKAAAAVVSHPDFILWLMPPTC